MLRQTGQVGVTPTSNKVADPVYWTLGDPLSGASGHRLTLPGYGISIYSFRRCSECSSGKFFLITFWKRDDRSSGERLTDVFFSSDFTDI